MITTQECLNSYAAILKLDQELIKKIMANFPEQWTKRSEPELICVSDDGGVSVYSEGKSILIRRSSDELDFPIGVLLGEGNYNPDSKHEVEYKIRPFNPSYAGYKVRDLKTGKVVLEENTNIVLMRATDRKQFVRWSPEEKRFQRRMTSLSQYVELVEIDNHHPAKPTKAIEIRSYDREGNIHLVREEDHEPLGFVRFSTSSTDNDGRENLVILDLPEMDDNSEDSLHEMISHPFGISEKAERAIKEGRIPERTYNWEEVVRKFAQKVRTSQNLSRDFQHALRITTVTKLDEGGVDISYELPYKDDRRFKIIFRNLADVEEAEEFVYTSHSNYQAYLIKREGEVDVTEEVHIVDPKIVFDLMIKTSDPRAFRMFEIGYRRYSFSRN